MSANATVLWTGGKDSALAFYEAKLLGYEIKSITTFIPREPKFLAHPLSFMKYQAKALDLPHYILEINEPFKKNYEIAINSLREKQGIDTLITGDIAEVGGEPNWIKECCKNLDMDVFTPLWGIDRPELIDRLLSYRFKIIFSCVKKPWFTDDWIGIEINKESLEQLRKISAKTGLDICGEEGEYHTLTIDGPIFKKSIHISEYSRCIKDSLIYIDIQNVNLKEKH